MQKIIVINFVRAKYKNYIRKMTTHHLSLSDGNSFRWKLL